MSVPGKEAEAAIQQWFVRADESLRPREVSDQTVSYWRRRLLLPALEVLPRNVYGERFVLLHPLPARSQCLPELGTDLTQSFSASFPETGVKLNAAI